MRPNGEPFYSFPEWKELRGMMPHLPKLADGGTTDLDAMKLALMNKGGTMPQHERDANLEKFLKDSAVKDRLYHGTSAAFNQFDPKKIGSSTDEGWLGHGHYFTTDPSVAGVYGSAVMPVHISAKNPYDMNGQNFSKVIKEHGGPKKFSEWLEKQGYDSATMWSQYMVLHPHQIKSATGNRGTYDPTNPDITMKRGGTIKDHITITERPL